MKYRLPLKLALVALPLLLVWALVFGLRGSAERTHIKSLAVQAYAGNTNAVGLLRAAGSNAVPELAALARYRISNWRNLLSRKVTELPAPLRKQAGQWLAPRSEKTQVREAVAYALGSLGDQAGDAVPVLVYQLGDQEGNVRWEAAKSLAQIGKTSVPALIGALTDQANAASGTAIYALGLIGPGASDAIPALLPYLNHTNIQIRGSAEDTFSKLGPEAVVALLQLTESGTQRERASANRIIHRLNSSLEPPIRSLRKLAKDESPTTRARAVEALGTLRPITSLSVTAMVAALNDPTPTVRLAAISAVSKVGAKAAIALPALKPLTEDPEETTRVAAKFAVGRIEALAAVNAVEATDKAE